MRISVVFLISLASVLPACRKGDSKGGANNLNQVIPSDATYVGNATSDVLSSNKLPPDADTTPVSPSNEEKVAQDKFKTAYESWTRKAVAEFPDLGVANSKLNLAFLTRVKEMRERNAEDLKYPNWPYLLATQLNGEFLAAKASAAQSAPQASVNAKPQIISVAPQSKPATTTPKSEIMPSKSGVSIASMAVSGTEVMPIAGTKRAAFLSGCGVPYNPCGTWAGVHKLVIGEASVAIIDMDWTNFRHVIQEADPDDASAAKRVRKDHLKGLKARNFGKVNLYFAHSLKQPIRQLSPGSVRALLRQGNWKVIGGPDQGMGFADWDVVYFDSYCHLKRGNYSSDRFSLPMDVFMKKCGLDYPSKCHLLSDDRAEVGENEVALITEKTSLEKLSSSWKKFDLPILEQPLFAVFKEAEEASILPVLQKLLEAGLKSGDLR